MNLRFAHNLTFSTDRIYIIGLFAVLFGLFALYTYFVSLSVVHVVIRQETEQGINRLNTEISRLEADYIAAQHALSAEIASLDGFVATEQKIFIDRADTALVLSANDQR